MCLWLHFISDTKISLRSQVQIAFPSLAAADEQWALPWYRDFLNQIKSLCAQTRAALPCFAGKTPSEKQPAPKDFKEWPKPSSYSLGKNYFGNQPKALWSINMVLKAWSTRSHTGMQPVWQSSAQMLNIWCHDTVPAPSSPGWVADREHYGTFKLLRDFILWIFFSVFYFFSI